jgi:hypothetical protein
VTIPTGRSFLSYRRGRGNEAELLVAAQHDVGIPTWRDVQDLRETPLADELRQVLANPEIANAVLWLTREVAESPVMLRLELPALLERARARDGFFVVPVAAGGLDYGDLAGPGGVLAAEIRDHLRETRRKLGALGKIHLFQAVPAGLAVLLGQYLNTLGPVQTYEHIPIDSTGRYQKAALLQPSL